MVPAGGWTGEGDRAKNKKASCFLLLQNLALFDFTKEVQLTLEQ